MYTGKGREASPEPTYHRSSGVAFRAVGGASPEFGLIFAQKADAKNPVVRIELSAGHLPDGWKEPWSNAQSREAAGAQPALGGREKNSTGQLSRLCSFPSIC